MAWITIQSEGEVGKREPTAHSTGPGKIRTPPDSTQCVDQANRQPSQSKTNKWWITAGPTSQTLAQQWSIICPRHLPRERTSSSGISHTQSSVCSNVTGPPHPPHPLSGHTIILDEFVELKDYRGTARILLSSGESAPGSWYTQRWVSIRRVSSRTGYCILGAWYNGLYCMYPQMVVGRHCQVWTDLLNTFSGDTIPPDWIRIVLSQC